MTGTGILNLDKPEGKSSAHIVNIVKHITGCACGHFGTLDPFATGVLPVGVGNATRLFDYFLTKEKTYVARFRFGMTTDTLDPSGTVLSVGRVPSEEELLGALPGLVGTFDQIPPIYSAKSVDGRRSYKLARRGESVELEAKRVTVTRFDLLRRIASDEYEFLVTCGAGTYIRALARDLAALCGTAGYCTALRRTASGIFTEETAVSPDRLTPENVEEFLIPTDSVLPFPTFSSEDIRIVQGQEIRTELADGVYKFYYCDTFYGLVRATGGFLKAEKKLC